MHVGRLCGGDSVERHDILKALEAKEQRRKGGSEQLGMHHHNNNPLYF